MRYTLRIGTYFGIPVRVHWTFPLILILFGVEAWMSGGWFAAFSAVLLVASVFVCVVLHEFGHSLQARRYGVRVRDIVLLPIGGMARAERIPEKPMQEIIVAAAGPLVNFALALFLFGIIWVRKSPFQFESEFLANLLWINIVLGVFNLTPAFPMDGGRILRGVFATRMTYTKATRYAKNVGQVIAILFVVLGFMYSQLIMLPLIAVFIFFGAMNEERMVRVKFALADKNIVEFIRDGIPVFEREQPIIDVVGALGPHPLPVLAVADRGELIGAVDVRDLFDAASEGRESDPISEVTQSDFPLIDAHASAAYAYFLIRSKKAKMAAVIRDGEYIGLVHFADLASTLG